MRQRYASYERLQARKRAFSDLDEKANRDLHKSFSYGSEDARKRSEGEERGNAYLRREENLKPRRLFSRSSSDMSHLHSLIICKRFQSWLKPKMHSASFLHLIFYRTQSEINCSRLKILQLLVTKSRYRDITEIYLYSEKNIILSFDIYINKHIYQIDNWYDRFLQTDIIFWTYLSKLFSREVYQITALSMTISN